MLFPFGGNTGIETYFRGIHPLVLSTGTLSFTLIHTFIVTSMEYFVAPRPGLFH